MGKAELMKSKGWFTTAGRDGDRTLEQQMIGLEQLFREVPGKTVIDAGAAEGLISIELAKAGAVRCIGLEIVANHVAVGRELIGDLPVTLEIANLNHYDVSQLGTADIVLALAILHKVKEPSALCAALARRCSDLCVIRLPPYGPVIVDARSHNVEHDIAAVMEAEGFTLESATVGPLAEWLGYFRRRIPEAVEPIEPAPAEPEVVPTPVPEVPVEPVAEVPPEPAPEAPAEVVDEAPVEVADNRPSTRRVPRAKVKAEEVAPMGTDSGLLPAVE